MADGRGVGFRLGGRDVGRRCACSRASAAESRLKSDVSFLADDAREGRAPGTGGIEAAAAYIAGEFHALGLKPAPGAEGFFQPFTISGNAKLGKPAELAFHGPDDKTIEVKSSDLSPLAIGVGGTLKDVPIVFSGYGITAKGASTHGDYDDYAGLDVKGKAVLVIRKEPKGEKSDTLFGNHSPSDFATFRHKATNAFQHGAAAVLLVNDAGEASTKDRILGLNQAGPDVNSALPFVMLTRSAADALLEAAHEPKLDALEKEIEGDQKPHSRALKGWKLSATVDIARNEVKTRNVVAVLEGAGPLADETVVVGGHYDHLGRGGLMSGSLSMLSSDIHNGADDNASGTSMVLEMARRLARRPDAPPRRVLFMAFSGEERGLLGSQHYVTHPLIPLEKTVMMVNFDMVGRLNKKQELTMIGTGTVPGMDALVAALGASSGLKIKTINGLSDGFGGSDHESFYNHQIPVLFAFTGIHTDYHRVTDDSDRINFAGMARIADYCELLLLDLVRRPERPAFVKLPPRARTASREKNGNADPGAHRLQRVSRDDARLRRERLRQGGEARGRPRREPGRTGRLESRRHDHQIRGQAGFDDLRLHGELVAWEARRRGGTWRSTRRQRDDAQGDARQAAVGVRCGMRRNPRRLVWALIFSVAGCGVGEVDDALTVATTWPADERAAWAERVQGSQLATPLRWLVLAPGDDLAHVATRTNPPDIILGAPASTCERLARNGLLEANSQGQAWSIAAQKSLIFDSTDDPRVHPRTLSALKSALDGPSWSKGYARLVASRDLDDSSMSDQLEGVAALRRARHAVTARALIDALATPTLMESKHGSTTTGATLDADALLADLLGATLVDARDERLSAWNALESANHPAKAEADLVEPPPWPPASVEKLLLTDPHAMPMLETLAAQLAPAADCRGWLLRSWLTPKRAIDGNVLTEIATAAHGRLVREPRFRAWLRSEWTAWARQRYRRVARVANATGHAQGG